MSRWARLATGGCSVYRYLCCLFLVFFSSFLFFFSLPCVDIPTHTHFHQYLLSSSSSVSISSSRVESPTELTDRLSHCFICDGIAFSFISWAWEHLFYFGFGGYRWMNGWGSSRSAAKICYAPWKQAPTPLLISPWTVCEGTAWSPLQGTSTSHNAHEHASLLISEEYMYTASTRREQATSRRGNWCYTYEMMMMNDDDPMSMLIPRTCHSLSNNFKTRSQPAR